MKEIRHLVLLASTLFYILPAFAQKDSSGIYKTAEDFQERKLSYAINCKIEKHKINPTVFFKGSEVKVKHSGTTYNLNKRDLFGYRTCSGKEYRFVADAEYGILNSGADLLVYFYQHPAHSPKTAGQYPPKYFFSRGPASALKELTKLNLKTTYPDNHKFHDALDANFKEDNDLHEYDTFHKMYKINWLLNGNDK